MVAALYLKNTVFKQWKKPRTSSSAPTESITEEEKALLRAKLLQNIDEDAPKVKIKYEIREISIYPN